MCQECGVGAPFLTVRKNDELPAWIDLQQPCQKQLPGVSDFRRQNRAIASKFAQNARNLNVGTKQYSGGTRGVLRRLLRIFSLHHVWH